MQSNTQILNTRSVMAVSYKQQATHSGGHPKASGAGPRRSASFKNSDRQADCCALAALCLRHQADPETSRFREIHCFEERAEYLKPYRSLGSASPGSGSAHDSGSASAARARQRVVRHLTTVGDIPEEERMAALTTARLEYQRIAEAFVHPLKLRILALMTEKPAPRAVPEASPEPGWSPKRLYIVVGEPLAQRELSRPRTGEGRPDRAGRHQTAPGALEHYYTLV